jgi:hypothetical protein
MDKSGCLQRFGRAAVRNRALFEHMRGVFKRLEARHVIEPMVQCRRMRRCKEFFFYVRETAPACDVFEKCQFRRIDRNVYFQTFMDKSLYVVVMSNAAAVSAAAPAHSTLQLFVRVQILK